MSYVENCVTGLDSFGEIDNQKPVYRMINMFQLKPNIK